METNSKMEDEGLQELDQIESSPQIVRKPKRTRNYNWTDAEVRTLMKSWYDHHKLYTSNPFGCSRRLLYDKISFDIRRFGFQRTRIEAQNKLQNLIKMYRKEKEQLKQSGEKFSKWRYYYLVKHIVEPDPEQVNKSLQDYMSSEEDSKDNVIDNTSNAFIIKLSNSVASDSDNAGSSHALTDSQDLSDNEEDSYIQPPRKRQNNIEGALQDETEDEEDISIGPTSRRRRRQSNVEEILCGFLTEFKRSNAQLEKNDREMMGLMKENNQLCKKQIELLSMFLNK